MKQPVIPLMLLCALSALLLSLPWLVPHTGALALAAFVPLLCADAMSRQYRMKRFWPYALLTFVLWNAATTFWVCEATVGGGIFAILANALQMTVIWGLFRLSGKLLRGPLPYIFLAAMWIAWEARYFDVDISWPWLVLGHAFAGSTHSVQWYEYTGVMGGSLWVWLCNLGFFGLIVSASDGNWRRWNGVARFSAAFGMLLAVAGPLVLSRLIYDNYEEKSEGTLDVLIAQPNFDPYHKFESMSQAEQTAVLLDLFDGALPDDSLRTAPVLLMAPETFTSDILLNDPQSSPTVRRFHSFMQQHPRTELLFGASTFEFFDTHASPDILARPYGGGGWMISRNSAVLENAQGECEFFHKSKLVIGTELTPYPKVFVPLDNWLSDLFGVPGLMGRCKGQDEVTLLHVGGDIPIGCAVCYESVYGDYCTEYVKKGAEALTVITNDAWWGDTPGYRQHLRFSSLRAIELRRDIARCGNTGISCFIDQRGDILSETAWWEPATLSGELNLNSGETFYVRNGDMVGGMCTLVFLLFVALLVVRAFLPRRQA
ncbi:MAG: apolipoprotein N-acyltransferase [Bacteroidetes bacterium]|uniref:Apolipoprotein N-acyltransferase n=1 Tax=Candidatus Cryptobacteroides avistercoris TaxID=2840758 RepID=A0A9D9NNI1_9BACT|nr:apolipoprotein N-acyltransferase [Candidatus Cryptobacteroides avistercoris]